MLFFELFPAVFAVVSLIVALSLYAMNHTARDEPDDPPPAPKRPVDPGARESTGRGRPSMR